MYESEHDQKKESVETSRELSNDEEFKNRHRAKTFSRMRKLTFSSVIAKSQSLQFVLRVRRNCLQLSILNVLNWVDSVLGKAREVELAVFHHTTMTTFYLTYI